MLTKLKGAGLLLLVVLVIWATVEPNGGGPGRDDDDDARTIDMIALTSNDTLALQVIVTSSIHGRIIEVPLPGSRDLTFRVEDNSWDETITLQKGEKVRIVLSAWVEAERLGDKDTWARCRIIDDGRRVEDKRAVVQPFRTEAVATCSYVT